MTRERGSFGGNTFHQVAVCHDAINVRLDNFVIRLIEGSGEMRRSNRHANALSKSLAERTRRRLYPWCQSIFRMARRFAVKLTEILDLFKRKVITCQMQQRIQEHRTMPTRENEAVTAWPFRIAR